MEPANLKKPWISTPLIESAALSKAAGCRIFLKLENLQPAGSFKSRGIGNLILRTIHRTPPAHRPHLHFYSSSGGNAGLACVTAARSLSLPATVVVPHSTKPSMISKIRAAGATDVIQRGASWAEADKYLREEVLTKDADGVYVPPFEHADIWEGVSGMVGEMGAQLARDGDGEEEEEEEEEEGEMVGKPDAVVCSVGGGGLFCGVMLGLERQKGWEDVKVLAMETRGAESLAKSLEKGELVTLPGITSIATGLGARRVADRTFEYARRGNVRSVVLEDAEAAMGCWRLADDERILVEPACGVSVAVCYDGRLRELVPGLTAESKVVVVVCGGNNVSVEMLAGWRKEYAFVEKMTTNEETVPSTMTAPDPQADRK